VAGVNKIILVGNLGRDPEMRYLPDGRPVTNFTIAVNRKFKGRDGEQREETEWFRIACFDRLAEISNEYLAKGRQVYVEGRVKVHTWDDQSTGEKRAQMEVTATELQMLGARGEEGAPGGRQASGTLANDNTDFENMPF
jgi:single-strand DNA-binding protein